MYFYFYKIFHVLIVPITTHTHVRRKSIGEKKHRKEKKRNERKEKEIKRKGITHPVTRAIEVSHAACKVEC